MAMQTPPIPGDRGHTIDNHMHCEEVPRLELAPTPRSLPSSGSRQDKRGGLPHTPGDLTTAVCTGQTTNYGDAICGRTERACYQPRRGGPENPRDSTVGVGSPEFWKGGVRPHRRLWQERQSGVPGLVSFELGRRSRSGAGFASRYKRRMEDGDGWLGL